ncbi:hypothetical protein [Mycobacterium sp. NAZ190054]|uniref:hypothetical protein n=1 Tax=Mycobacterium sp. NAZ190054 TaxID=1747766 RepID=UPI000B295C0A
MSAIAAHYAALPASDEKDCSTTPAATQPGPALGADNDAVDRLVAARLAGPC